MMNGIMMQYFHWYHKGNKPLWRELAEEVKALSDNGVTGIWVPPPYKGSGGKDDVGYGIYDLYDLGEFDRHGVVETKYGSKAEFLNAVTEAHNNKVQVYADVVLNHKAGADNTQWVKAARVDGENRNFTYGDECWIEVWTQFDFPGRGAEYSEFKWDYKHFDGVNHAHNLEEKDKIYKFLVPGKDWEKMVSDEKGNYDYLMHSDLDMNHPEVRTELARWGEWFLNHTGVDGFRIDAVKHIQFSFFRDWLSFLKKRFHKRSFFAAGEYLSDNVNELKYFIEKTAGLMSLFDFPLQKKFYEASRHPDDFDMRELYKNTLTEVLPYLSVTFVDNHDTQPCQKLERWVDWWFRPHAYALILLREQGYPCVFYPDYYGAEYEDKWHINLTPVPHLKKIMKIRKDKAHGRQRDYFQHKNMAGWTREGYDSKTGLAVLLTNGGGGSKSMKVGERHSNSFFRNALNESQLVKIDSSGWGNFYVEGKKLSVWVPDQGV